MSTTYESAIILSGGSYAWLHYHDGTAIKELVFDKIGRAHV